ncbi:hypothetical protein RUND412_001889 [Rhizina undulata]
MWKPTNAVPTLRAAASLPARSLSRSSVLAAIPVSNSTSALPRRTSDGFTGVKSSRELPEAWFAPSLPRGNGSSSHGSQIPAQDDHKPVDERTLGLGKTLRILQERLPTLLQSPLPTEILSPSISLHLFPTTHPHLPTVRGRVAYIAALWTAPVAWGRLPGTNVRLEVLSERMIKPSHPGESEKLIVKWRTSSPSSTTTSSSSNSNPQKIQLGTTAVDDGEFSGLFIFEFDEKGRIQSHTIENADENLGGDQPSSVITITEWLLKKAAGKEQEVPAGGFALPFGRWGKGSG